MEANDSKIKKLIRLYKYCDFYTLVLESGLLKITVNPEMGIHYLLLESIKDITFYESTDSVNFDFHNGSSMYMNGNKPFVSVSI